MSGNSHAVVLLTPRDLHLFRELETAKLMDREMIQRVCSYPSINRANDRLLRLHRAGFLKRYLLGTEAGGRKAIYALSPKSAATIPATTFWKFQRPENTVLVGNVFVEHQSAVNWVWIGARYGTDTTATLLRWLNFTTPFSENIPLAPDGYFELKASETIHSIFLEADLGTEATKVWERKVQLYLKLATSGEFERIFHQTRFKVAIVATSERRLRNLRKLIAKHTNKIFFFNLLETINRDGLLAHTWLRPEGGALHPLV